MHPYTQLARHLSPMVGPEEAGDVDWTLLLQLANLHKCTPLWYVRLWEKGLLGELPTGLVEYLAQLHAANVERNSTLKSELAEIVGWFAKVGIEVVLLKGAAVLADDLYGDPGARLMGDLDLLVPPDRADEAQQLLLGQGYALCPPEEEKVVYRLPTDVDYHLEPLYRPGSGIVVEVHHRMMSRQGGRALPVDRAWAEKVPAPGFGDEVFLPSPGWRLLHNALHALLPYGEFIKGQVLLCNLAEAAALLEVGHELDWSGWEDAGGKHRLRAELNGYALLLHELMDVPFPANWPPLSKNANLLTLLVAGGAREVVSPYEDDAKRLRRHYLARLPGYAWHNVCYAPGWWRLPERFGCLLTRGLRSSARKKLRL
ncbi:nucleotidyltransferase family protein [Deltaproteobacteria bacterium IMCC39524]|nr:nucleotidyltransferase family protein [Deltaproteobacteria bacterium IMCC39524]